MYKIESVAGDITIFRPVIIRIVAEAVKRQVGKAQLSNAKGQIPGMGLSRFKSLDPADVIEVTSGPDGVDIRLYVVIRFGSSIGAVTDTLIQDIREDLRKMAAVEANSVAVVVTGLISRNIAPRNIVVRK